MIDVHTWTTPNGHKIHIMMEELGLPWRAIPVDIGAGAQFDPDFLKISPNNKIPAIIDHDGPGGPPIAIFESGAILIYLAEKTGQLLAASGEARYEAMKWLFFQMANTGPMLGQVHHFRHYAPEKFPYAIDRYTNEAKRLYGVLDRRLTESEWLAGEEYTIADVANFPWLRSWERQGVTLSDYPHVKRWFEAIAARPAVERGVSVLSERSRSQPMTDKEREVLFGATQYQRR
jgi:GST-like protein